MSSLNLPTGTRKAFDRLAADAARVFGPRFVALAAYSPRSSVVFARDLTAADLDALAALVETWHREDLAVPLVLTPDEFLRSLDAFPLEYQAILDRHEIIAGHSPFAGARVDPEDLRRACEVQAKAHAIHLRQGWLQAEGRPARLAELVERSAGPLHTLLTHVAMLSGAPAADADDLVRFAEQTVGMPGDLVRVVLTQAHGGATGATLPGGLPAYLAAADRLWTFIDTWRAR